MLYRFHLNLFARPAAAVAAGDIVLRGLRLPTLRAATFDAFLPVSFEQAIEALNKLPRLDSEPDGFFVIAGDHQGRRWQVDGHLFDFGGRLHRVEIHGECPPDAFDGILRCVGWPAVPLVFELVMEGVAFEEPALRQWAAQTAA
ncbi:MAG: hypothetical protein DCC67_12355 [Planctomycetota bacterium]|nr:MAG: hypothetical protein DCC67_12355 [Planctomycetota bacterium]